MVVYVLGLSWRPTQRILGSPPGGRRALPLGALPARGRPESGAHAWRTVRSCGLAFDDKFSTVRFGSTPCFYGCSEGEGQATCGAQFAPVSEHDDGGLRRRCPAQATLPADKGRGIAVAAGEERRR